jgi:ELWxxDGT repeat protein
MILNSKEIIMKKYILFSYILLAVMIGYAGNAQKLIYPKPGDFKQLPFAKKQPPVIDKDQTRMPGTKMQDVPTSYYDAQNRQMVISNPGRPTLRLPANSSVNKKISTTSAKPVPANFHLTKDINAISEGAPNNYPANWPNGFAVLNNVTYFSAEDGIHGRELWRSDGTAGGTFMVKDIFPGESTSDLYGIVVLNSMLYFTASTPGNIYVPWVSDGTEAGTHMLKSTPADIAPTNASNYVDANGTIYFIASQYGAANMLWKSDGTDAGTVPVIDIFQVYSSDLMLELTAVDDLVFFIANTNTGMQLFRSDGTDAGTYLVKEIGFYNYNIDAPTQLTAYNHKLYFAANDGSGRRLWVSDGTYDGTTYAPGFNDVLLQGEFLNMYSNFPIRIFNDALYIAGYTYGEGSGLYKFDATNGGDGIVLVKDLTPGLDINYVVAPDMRVVGDELFFKVFNFEGGEHAELWASEGDEATTRLVKSFPPGDNFYNYSEGNGVFYFHKRDNSYGSELWKSNGTGAGTVLVKDINPGRPGAYPDFLTFCNNKLFFSAQENSHGNELYVSDGTAAGTSLVKDINTTTTATAYVGQFYKSIGASPTGVLFNAYTDALGFELYKSDGTASGTGLLNDINAGSDYSNPFYFLLKNNVNYFNAETVDGMAFYKTNGLSSGLTRMSPYISRTDHFIVTYNATDNGRVFYVVYNYNNGMYELWCSDGTDAGTYLLSSTLNYNATIATAGNTVFFAAADADHGYELWKSDGTPAGTKMITDINPGSNSSDPYSLAVYKNEVYFGAYNGLGLNFQLWKSDGTAKGTIKLKNIIPGSPTYPYSYNTNFFCISNNTLFFTALDLNSLGAELWKTNGTEVGTKLVKDINPYNSSYPNYLTDVKGTLFFFADDGVHGTELWLSKGTDKETKLVKDIEPGYASPYTPELCSAGGKLFFVNGSTYPTTVWSSDGTEANTKPITGLLGVYGLTGSGNNVFFGMDTYKYGRELYVGDAGASTLIASKVSVDFVEEKTGMFDIKLFPNPAHDHAILQVDGDVENLNVIVTDITGKKVWQQNYSGEHTINLPLGKLVVGAYLITVHTTHDTKTLKFMKE